jgi:aldehyde dehydrogenase (NAD+)
MPAAGFFVPAPLAASAMTLAGRGGALPSSSSSSRKIISDSLGEMQGVVNTIRYYAGWADEIEGRTVPVRGNFLSYTLRQPVGLVGQIIPWSFPLLMLAWK